jgi:hypothetical protein
MTSNRFELIYLFTFNRYEKLIKCLRIILKRISELVIAGNVLLNHSTVKLLRR